MYNTEKLKSLRKENRLTIYDMAKKLKMSASLYSQIENKNRRLFYDTAFLIAQILNTEPDKIFIDSHSL